MLNNALVGGPPISGKGGKKGGKADKNGVANAGGGLSAHGTIMKDFRLELAKSGASKCGVCEEKIKKVCNAGPSLAEGPGGPRTPHFLGEKVIFLGSNRQKLEAT